MLTSTVEGGADIDRVYVDPEERRSSLAMPPPSLTEADPSVWEIVMLSSSCTLS